ncbi:MAG TPA: adenylate/guanylate cyclase domain-containing protein, partial [Candidatus Binatia bacterium]|nr:adenylate/guanylate cyclase domain-containing protein [Candidatus Binatia bacterium]
MLRLRHAAYFGIAIGILGLLLSFLPWVDKSEEDLGLAVLFDLRAQRKPPSEVVVVSIDKESSESLNVSGNPARWHRSIHAQLIEKLAARGALAIIFDVYFIEPKSSSEDNLLGAAVKKAANVVLAEPLRAKELSPADFARSTHGEHRLVRAIKPIDIFSEAAVATAPFVLPRLPVRVNYYWTFQPDAGDSPTFPVVAFHIYAREAYPVFRRLLEKVSPEQAAGLPSNVAAKQNGTVTLLKAVRQIFENQPWLYQNMLAELERLGIRETEPTKHDLIRSLIELYGGSPKRYLNFYGPPRTIATIPFHRALKLGEDPQTGEDLELNGKVIFVGMSETLASEREDSFYTVFSQANGVFLSGVEIAATAFSNLLANDYIKPVGARNYLLTILVWGILVGLICRMMNTLAAALCVVVLSALFLIAAEYQFQSDGTWYPIVVPLILQAPMAYFGSVLWNLVETNRERHNIRKALGYYVPGDMVDLIAKNRVDLRRGGQTVYGVCLYTDIAGYTSVSENLGPRELSELMHRYFEAVFEPIRKNGGLITDLKGDSILAIWKGSRHEAALCQQACTAALDVAHAVSQFNKSSGWRLPTRIGIHAGSMFLGNIGAADHYEYGPTGDTVNTASRLDNLNKMLGTEILVSEDAISGLDSFVTRKAGTFRLKGKTQPLTVYELLCQQGEAAEQQQKACTAFLDALETFRR